MSFAAGAGLLLFAAMSDLRAVPDRVAVSSVSFEAVDPAPEAPSSPPTSSPPTSGAQPLRAWAAPPSPSVSIQQRGEAALRRLSYPYQQLGYAIAFLPGIPGYFGRGFHERHRIEIYVRGGQSDDALAHVVAHEIGHAIDWMYHTPSRDHEWLQLRGVNPATEWAPCPFCSDFGAPSGDYAESFALWQLGNTEFRGTLAPRPTSAQLQRLAHLFYP
jgi:hypothetical protein